MPKHRNMPPEGAGMLAAALALAAQNPQEAEACLCRCLCGGLSAYRAARKARTREPGRFAAFVTGLSEALADPAQRALVGAALSPLQQRALFLGEEDLG